MAYKKITVGGTVYEYAIGRSHVKIKGVGVALKADIGTRVAAVCECCGTSLVELYGEHWSHYYNHAAVRPSDIRKHIESAIASK